MSGDAVCRRHGVASCICVVVAGHAIERVGHPRRTPHRMRIPVRGSHERPPVERPSCRGECPVAAAAGHDQHLAASQGAAEALERVVNCLLLTHPDPGSVRAMISHNGPRLFEGLAGNHSTSATRRAILGNVEDSIAGELDRRASKADPRGTRIKARPGFPGRVPASLPWGRISPRRSGNSPGNGLRRRRTRRGSRPCSGRSTRAGSAAGRTGPA